MSAVTLVGRHIVDTVNWVRDHKTELALGAYLAASVGISIFAARWIGDAEMKFIERCERESLPLSISRIFTDTIKSTTYSCGPYSFTAYM